MIPNPWDAGSARVFEALGFKALATTSSGFAFTLGRLDGGVTLDELVDHVRALDQASSLPVSVDLENGYGPEPADAAHAITRAAAAGAVGGSIEDFDPAGHLYDREHATERIAAAREAADDLGFPFTLTARAENHIRGNPDLDDTIARLQAYERAGADVLYAPGLRSGDEIRAVVEATSKPLNVLAHKRLSMREIAGAGATRVSVGGALAWVAVSAMASAAEQIRATGEFSSLVREAAARGVVRARLGEPRDDRLLLGLRGRREARERGREQRVGAVAREQRRHEVLVAGEIEPRRPQEPGGHQHREEQHPDRDPAQLQPAQPVRGDVHAQRRVEADVGDQVLRDPDVHECAGEHEQVEQDHPARPRRRPRLEVEPAAEPRDRP